MAGQVTLEAGLAPGYRDRSVFLTGHTGFKGSWLATWLQIAGARVTGYALPPEPGRPSLFEGARVADGMDSRFGDIRDLDSLEAAMRTAEPEFVFHLAAQSLVRRSYREPVATYATNVMGTAHLLDAVRRVPSVKAVVVVTSDKCYENREWPHGYREADPMGGHDPYSSSKGCAELVTAGYRSSFFAGDGAAGVASARAGNVIGGGDWAEDRLVPDLMRGLAAGEPVVVRSPAAVRPWQHVLDPLRGYLELGLRLAKDRSYSEAWNFGPPDESAVPVREVVDRVLQLWGPVGTGAVRYDPAAATLHEAHYLHLDWGKARARLGWRPMLGLDEAIRLTVEWHRTQRDDPGSAAAITRRQIEQYSASLP